MQHQKIEQARLILPLQRMMEQRGDLAAGSHGSITCPFCKKKSASLKEVSGRWWFKCFRSACPSATSGEKKSWDEVGYLAFKTGLSRKEAVIAYLKEAGVWNEELAPSILPGQKGRKKKLPAENDFVGGPGTSPPLTPANTPGGASSADAPDPPQAEGAKLPVNVVPMVTDVSGAGAADGPRACARSPENGGGGSGGGVKPLGDGGGEEPEPPARNRGLLALREFHARITLTEADAELISRKRGLPRAACVAFGFKSSQKSNKEVLESLLWTGEGDPSPGKFTEDELVRAGLFKRGEDGKARPQPQLYGLGRTNKKDKNGEWIWDWTYPILIPYFDRDGEVISIRPHKGNVAGQASRLFIARFRKGWNASQLPQAKARNTSGPGSATFPALPKDFKSAHCVITESEFKACAIYYVFGGEVGAAGIPGITQSKNYTVMEDLKEWLREDCRPEKLVVAFDNEEKGDPKLPGFKPDKRKRFDAEIWARYLALTLEQSFCEARVCRLPKEWRDENGKADWDGALARMMKEEASGKLPEATGGPPVPPKIRQAFSAALNAAVGRREFRQGELFSQDDEKIIKNGLDRLFYTPRLPNGGDKELALARKLVKLANGKLKDTPGLGLMKLAEQYRETVGWYYTQKPLSDAVQDRWMKRQQAEREKPDGNRDLIWFCELRLKGIPTQVANFRMEVFFTLIRADGKRDRMVEIITNKGERSGRVRLDAESFSTPSGRTGFRVWLANHGNGCWKVGERELQDLQLDVASEAAFMDVHEITAVGYDEASRLWFMGDCAYKMEAKNPDGIWMPSNAEMVPDQDGVYWHDGVGYQLAKTGSGGQEFRQGLPLMHPTEVLQFQEKPGEEGEVQFCLVPVKNAKEPEGPVLGQLFVESAMRFKESLGGYDGFLLVGAFLSFLGGPEFFKREHCFPGFFEHGETGHGKSTQMGWGMEYFGFHSAPGVGASRNSTVVGMQQLLEQYSNLPAWLTDFSADVSDEKAQIMHDAYNRVLSAKWSADGTARKVRTMFVIDGESRPQKTSTRFRYLQVLVSKMNRKTNQVPWFERNRCFFFSLGRSLLRRREEFSRMMMQNFDLFRQEMVGVDTRQVQVHGAAYGAFMAADQMFGGMLSKNVIEEFRQFLKAKCAASSEEGQQAVNVYQFWGDLLSALQRGVFGQNRQELSRFFKVESTWAEHPPDAKNQDEHGNYIQGRWESWVIFMALHAVVDAMDKDARQRGKKTALNETDLREQMSHHGYWSPLNDAPGGLRRNFAGVQLRCCAILADKHELGYLPVPDEVLLESKRRRKDPELPGTNNFPAETKWIDPRKGDLFALIEAVGEEE